MDAKTMCLMPPTPPRLTFTPSMPDTEADTSSTDPSWQGDAFIAYTLADTYVHIIAVTPWKAFH